MNAPRTDVHAHLIPQLSDEVADAGGFTIGERLIRDDAPVGPPRIYQIDALLAHLDDAALERAVVTIPPPLYRQGLGPVAATTWVRGVNDALAEDLTDHPRLVVGGYLPLEHPGLAVPEAQTLLDSGVRVFTAGAGGGSPALDDAALDALWRVLAESGSGLVLHPGSSADVRLDRHYLNNLLGNPQETGLAAAQLLFGGILARHPALRIALVHCGGTLPAVLGRWQRGVDTARPGVDRTNADLVAEARRLWADGLAHDPRLVDLAATVFGEEHMLVGSDWPFPMGSTRPTEAYAHRTDDLGDRAARANAAAFLGF